MKNKNKRICFNMLSKKDVDFKIQLHYDELKTSEFFNSIVEGYILDDDRIASFVEEVKEKKKLSKTKIKKATDALVKKKKIDSAFALNEKEIENIFDILEEDLP